MAFVVEDGSGNADATAYISVAFFESYQDDRGRIHSGFASGLKEQAIVKATDFVEERFGRRFRGVRQTKGQGLEWPRLDAFDDDGFLLSGEDEIPRQLKRAVAEYTYIVLKLLDAELLPNPARPFATIDEETGEVVVTSAGQVISTREQVGPISESKTFANMLQYRNNTNVAGKSTLVDDLHIPEYPRADLWIEELLKSSTSISLVRA